MIGLVLGFLAWAAVGTLIRATASDAQHGFNLHMYVTLLLNVIGSFLLGAISGQSSNAIMLLGVGGLGSLTTFSTFISQIECIARESTTRAAVAFTLASIVLGVVAAWIGWSIA